MLLTILKHKNTKLILLGLGVALLVYLMIQSPAFAEEAENARSATLNSKYFGGDQKFWKDGQKVFTYIGGISLFVGTLLSMAGMMLAAKRAGAAKMRGDSSTFLKETKNYGKLILNFAYVGLFTGLIGILIGWLFGFAVK